MLQYLTAKPALAATTSIAALMIGVAVLLPVTEALGPIGQPPVIPTTETPPRPHPPPMRARPPRPPPPRAPTHPPP